MSDYEKLLAGLNACAGRGNSCAGCSYHCGTAKCVKDLIGDAAKMLEQQRAEIEQLVSERDAALDCVIGLCEACINRSCDMSSEPCFSCDGSSNWEWRGVQETQKTGENDG